MKAIIFLSMIFAALTSHAAELSCYSDSAKLNPYLYEAEFYGGVGIPRHVDLIQIKGSKPWTVANLTCKAIKDTHPTLKDPQFLANCTSPVSIYAVLLQRTSENKLKAVVMDTVMSEEDAVRIGTLDCQ